MINMHDILETINMIKDENLDIRTVTMGISLYDCASDSVDTVCDRIYDKITTRAEKLVSTGCDIEKELGIPIINKRVSVTPISLVGGKYSPDDYVKIAHTLDRAAHTVGINFIGGYSALVQKGFTNNAANLIASLPQALSETEIVCSSVNVSSTKAGINMDAVAMMGKIIKDTAYLTRDNESIGCAKLVVFANVPEDNPFMAGAFHGVGEAECFGSRCRQFRRSQSGSVQLYRACRDNQENSVQDNPYGAACRNRGIKAPWRSIRNS